MGMRGKILERQGYQLGAYLILGGLLLYGGRRLSNDAHIFAGFSALQWMAVSWLLAGVFQFWIAFFWRLELYGKHISRRLGPAGFIVFRIGFVILGAARFLMLVPVALSTRNTMDLPDYLRFFLIIVSTPGIVWAAYGALFQFGFKRATGADHFDPAYRTAALESSGIFKHMRNPMYAIVLLVLYHPGLLWQSAPGLLLAAAHHAFVWVHYFCTEKPDLTEIYKTRR